MAGPQNVILPAYIEEGPIIFRDADEFKLCLRNWLRTLNGPPRILISKVTVMIWPDGSETIFAGKLRFRIFA